ncbi:hypothetical protein [Aeromicrobium sp.]|uniref:hypothetical protein n=1 Tax=Aeromicrobium sp. TaxID=1871063 RepID=UPI00351959D8
MNFTTIGRACATVVITIAGINLATTPASADDPAPSCDPAVVQAALTKAEADALAAQKAYVTHTRTATKDLVKQLKDRETAEARAAEKEARRLAAAARKDPELRDEAKLAREAARAAAKEAARAQRASLATLKRQVKAERVVLKAQWDAAKKALRDQRDHAEECADAAQAPEPTESPEPPEPEHEGAQS